jgi:hypothetical protein
VAIIELSLDSTQPLLALLGLALLLWDLRSARSFWVARSSWRRPSEPVRAAVPVAVPA